jgi:tRNA/tmRNA/rRNA uracil-C5-methylase (TrmA/RlmC/RlmD family)
VIGIDLEEEAVMDASKNAEKNGTDRATFIPAKAEDALRELLSEKAWKGGRLYATLPASWRAT